MPSRNRRSELDVAASERLSPGKPPPAPVPTSSRCTRLIGRVFLLLPISVESGRMRPPYACIVIAAICFIAFAGTWLIDQEAAVRVFAIMPSRGWLQVGWLSSMFVHFGWLHLLTNMLFFYLVGPLLEDA